MPDLPKDDRPKNNLRWSDTRLRAGSTLILLPVALLLMWLGGKPWMIACALVGLGLAVEWLQLCGLSPRNGRGALLAALFVLLWAPLMLGFASPPWILFVFVASVVLILVRPWLGTGFAYAGLSILALIQLRSGEDGFANLLFLLPVVWASDIGAYVVGRGLGGPKLAPSISPGKTWSGSAGGAVTASLVGATIAGGIAGHPSQAGLIALVLAVVSQAGDLAESAAKRHFGVKDSGTMIPGHGGLWDRLDGVMAASFVAVVLAMIAGPGQYLWR